MADFATLITLFFDMFATLFQDPVWIGSGLILFFAYALTIHKASVEIWVMIFTPLLLLFIGYTALSDWGTTIISSDAVRFILAVVMAIVVFYAAIKLLSWNK